MSQIINVSRNAVMEGSHRLFGADTILIQITDPAQDAPKPKHEFADVFHFEFLDAEDSELFDEGFLISKGQAANIVGILELALIAKMNVVVHCNAGICRSGAVAEVGEIMGFEYVGNHKQPNLRVKKLMLNHLYGSLYN